MGILRQEVVNCCKGERKRGKVVKTCEDQRAVEISSLSLTITTCDLYTVRMHNIFTKTSVAIEMLLCQYFGSNERKRLRLSIVKMHLASESSLNNDEKL
jgi:hypothetical protein